MLTGEYEKDLWWTIRKYVSSGDVCVDVGANVGVASLFLAKSVGKAGKVICFEPGPRFCERLKTNLELNPSFMSVVEVHNLGVSDQPGKLHWAEDPEFPGNAYLFGSEGLEVNVVTLDSFLQPEVRRLNFLKIDVEGMELEVLRGAQGILRKFKPIVFFETFMDFEVYRNAPIRKDASDLLLELGYELYRVADDGELLKVSYPNFSHNTLALPIHS